jgi:hypothetical protein
MTKKRTEGLFSIIPDWVLGLSQINPLSRLLYAKITSLSSVELPCYAGNAFLAKKMGTSIRNIQKCLLELKEHELVEIKYVLNEKTKNTVRFITPVMDTKAYYKKIDLNKAVQEQECEENDTDSSDYSMEEISEEDTSGSGLSSMGKVAVPPMTKMAWGVNNRSGGDEQSFVGGMNNRSYIEDKIKRKEKKPPQPPFASRQSGEGFLKLPSVAPTLENNNTTAEAQEDVLADGLSSMEKVSAPNRNKKPKLTEAEMDSIAKGLIKVYRDKIKTVDQTRTRAMNNIMRLLRTGVSPADLQMAFDRYYNLLEYSPAGDPKYRYGIGNFFGKEKIYASFISDSYRMEPTAQFVEEMKDRWQTVRTWDRYKKDPEGTWDYICNFRTNNYSYLTGYTLDELKQIGRGAYDDE